MLGGAGAVASLVEGLSRGRAVAGKIWLLRSGRSTEVKVAVVLLLLRLLCRSSYAVQWKGSTSVLKPVYTSSISNTSTSFLDSWARRNNTRMHGKPDVSMQNEGRMDKLCFRGGQGERE